MRKIKSRKKGFTLLEYILLIAIVVAAFIAMQIYFKRALSGKWKAAIDTIGYGRQY